jgi:hypothetical protein
MKRRQLAEQQRMIAAREAEERARNVTITSAPWFYADPQRNIQVISSSIILITSQYM